MASFLSRAVRSHPTHSLIYATEFSTAIAQKDWKGQNKFSGPEAATRSVPWKKVFFKVLEI